MFGTGLDCINAGSDQNIPFRKLHFCLHGFYQAGSQLTFRVLWREEPGRSFFDEALDAGFDAAEGIVHCPYCIFSRIRAQNICNYYPRLIRYTE